MVQSLINISHRNSRFMFPHKHTLSEIMQNGIIVWISKDLMTIAKAMRRSYTTGKRNVYLIDLDKPVDVATKLKYENHYGSRIQKQTS